MIPSGKILERITTHNKIKLAIGVGFFKNLNSIRSMVRAIDVEVKRQIRLWEKGETVKPATLGWDDAAGKIKMYQSIV